MPFSRWFYPAGTLSQADKNTIAKGITDVYAEAYPRRATIVVFIEIPRGSFYTNGEVTEQFHRITVQHMSGSYDVKTLENDVRMRFRSVFKQFVEDRGHGYELQVEEIPAPQISLDNYITHQILAEPLFEKMVKDNKVYSGHLVQD